ncbi:uncharacterized protein N7482_009795 [Penicillium canariense]|uniref:Uncharacterized protein n=1 Tax=Penicillium canariense TaxID=189055 RepID=A0A9W9HQ36_9EURO|nr:uncharacterized protein N7482_009795 [Penicillium canariense]KAJ5153317.1 hypothetical protein N7482_009795 [Penicillium canariense]
MFLGLQPVSLSFIPREGEYDVICHHCSSSVDSLHQSISERNEDFQSPQSPPSRIKSCPGAFFSPAPDHDASPAVQSINVLSEPPLQSARQNPLVGMCMVQLPTLSANIMPSVMPTPAALEKALDIASTCSYLGSDITRVSKIFTENHRRTQKSSGSDADSERSVQSPCKTPVPNPAKRVDTPDPRVEHISSPNSRTGFDPAAELASSLLESFPKEGLPDSATILSASLASTRSLTAAVQRLEQLIAERNIHRRPDFNLRSLHRTGFKSDGPLLSKTTKVHSASPKRVRARHCRRRADRPSKTKSEALKTSEGPKPEQQNSATKRRDRREKLKRSKEDTGAPSRFGQTMGMQNVHLQPPSSLRR